MGRNAESNVDLEYQESPNSSAVNQGSAGWDFSLSLAYFLYGMIWLWWHGYLKSRDSGGSRTSLRDRAMRQLVLYFFRIVAVFVLAWVPAQIFSQIYTSDFRNKHWALFASGIFVAIQPTITFCMMLTKPDVQTYIWQLVTLYHCTSPQDDADHGNPRQFYSTKASTATASDVSRGVSALGYGTKFEDATGSTGIASSEVRVAAPADDNVAGNDATNDSAVEDDVEDNGNEVSMLGFTVSDFHSGDVPEEAVEAGPAD